jgi:PAS domain S-box-containing protein
MATKPTYEELVQRVKELEKKVAKPKEEALAESERKYRDVVENAHDGIAIIQDGQLKFVNQRLAQMTGYVPEEVVGTSFTIHVDPDEIADAVETYKRRMAGEQLPEKYERVLRHKNGSRIDTEIVAGPVPYQGKPADLVVIRDITDRKNMVKSLRESEENFRGIIENMVDVYYRADLEGNLIAVSPSGVKLLGYDSSEEMIGKSIAKEFYANPQEREYFSSEIMKQRKTTFEGTLKRKDGTLIVTETNSRLIHDERGKPVAVEGIIRDVSERKRMEDRLRERTRQLQVAHDQAIIYGQELNQEIIERKQAEEALQKIRDALEQRVEERTNALASRNKQLELEMTCRKHAEKSLRVSEEKWRSLVENAPSVFLIVDRDGIIQYVNRTVSGIEVKKVVGTSTYDYTLHEYHKVIKESIKHVLKTGQICSYESKGGSPGGDLAWYITQVGPIKKENQVVAIALVATDITKRKRMEKKLLEANEALRSQAHSLEELNSALKVLLERREKDREELEENVVSNVKELISPYVETLRNTRLDTKQITCVEIIESNLKEIVSPFLQKLALKYSGFTPKEIQIAGLIKQGKTTKEMAELFNLSTRTIKFHRQNIRAKLGLKNQRTNLASYLLSFP